MSRTRVFDWYARFENSKDDLKLNDDSQTGRFEKSRLKAMFIYFYDFEGNIHQEFVPKDQTVVGEYYLGVMERLWKRIVRIRPEYL